MRIATVSLLAAVLICGPSLSAAPEKKFMIEVVSLEEHSGPRITMVVWTAKIILPDGSHALALCGEAQKLCELDDGFPERLKRTINNGDVILTGFRKFEAKRKANTLTIYTATGKREYDIMDSW
jgi:hypothetical protein